MTAHLTPASPSASPSFDTLEPRTLLAGISFGDMVEHDAVYPPSVIASGDLNGDGAADLVVAGPFPYPSFAPAEDEVRVLLNDGRGRFVASKVSYPAGFAISALAVGDLDGDGHLDVVAANDTARGAVHVLYGAGDGTLHEARSFYAGSRPNDLAIADLNRDGLPDIVTANADIWSGEFTDEAPTPGAAVLYGRAEGGFQTARKIPTDAPVQYVEVGHFNSGRILDVALAGPVAVQPAVLPGISKAFVALGTANGSFRLAPPTIFAGRLVGMAAGDIDRSRSQDLVVALDVGRVYTNTRSAALPLRNRGNGTFYAAKPLATTMPVLTDVAVADLDHDGWPDVATVGHNPFVLAPFEVGAVSVFRNQRGSFGKPTDLSTVPWHATRLTVGTFDRDRLPDLAVALPRPSAVGVFLNRTSAWTTPSPAADLLSWFSWPTVAAGRELPATVWVL